MFIFLKKRDKRDSIGWIGERLQVNVIIYKEKTKGKINMLKCDYIAH